MHWYLPRVSNAHLLGNIDNDHAYQQHLFYSIQDVKLWHPESRTGSMYRFEWEDIAWNNSRDSIHFTHEYAAFFIWLNACQKLVSYVYWLRSIGTERWSQGPWTVEWKTTWASPHDTTLHCYKFDTRLFRLYMRFVHRTRVSIRRFHKGVLYSEHCQHCHAVPFRKATCWLQSSKNFTDAIVGCQSRPAHVLQPRCNHALYMRTLYGW